MYGQWIKFVDAFHGRARILSVTNVLQSEHTRCCIPQLRFTFQYLTNQIVFHLLLFPLFVAGLPQELLQTLLALLEHHHLTGGTRRRFFFPLWRLLILLFGRSPFDLKFVAFGSAKYFMCLSKNSILGELSRVLLQLLSLVLRDEHSQLLGILRVRVDGCGFFFHFPLQIFSIPGKLLGILDNHSVVGKPDAFLATVRC